MRCWLHYITFLHETSLQILVELVDCNQLIRGNAWMVQVWSNDKYKSVEHRVVVNENKARFSVPFFFNPSQSTNVAPVPQLLGENLPLYRQYNWGEFLNTRKGSNFKNLGVENVQIYHFAINRDENDVKVQV